MPYYAICATTETRSRPCALVQAFSEGEARRQIKRLRRSGELLHVPQTARLSVRRASRREAEALREWLLARPRATSAVGADEGFTARSRGRLAAFFELLWEGRVPAPAAAAPRPATPPRPNAAPDEFDYGEEDEAPSAPAAPPAAGTGAFDALFDGLAADCGGKPRKTP